MKQKINGLAAMNATLLSMQINRISYMEARFMIFLKVKKEMGKGRVPVKWVALELGEEDDSFYMTARTAEDLEEKGLIGLTKIKEVREGEMRRNRQSQKVWITPAGLTLLNKAAHVIELDWEDITRTETK